MRYLLWLGLGNLFWLCLSMPWCLGQAPPVPAPGTPNLPPVIPPSLPPTTSPPTMPGMPPGVAPGTPPGMPPGTTAPGTPATVPPVAAKPPTEVLNRNIQSWVADFKSTDPTKRDSALKVIPLFGYEAARKHAMKAVIQLVDDPDPGIRINAILVIGAVGFDNAEDLKAGVAKLSGAINKTVRGSMIRLHAARVLASLGPDASSAIGTLIATSDDPSWETRQAVAAALGRVGAPVYEDKPLPAGSPLNSLPLLKKEPSLTAMSKLNLAMIRDDSAAVRMEACQALIVMGPPLIADSKKYVQTVEPFLQAISTRLKVEKDPNVRIWLQLLNIMYDERVLESTVKSLINELATNDISVKIQALNALGTLGPKAKSALGAMISQLQHEDLDVVVSAINNILMLGSEAKDAIPEIEKLGETTKNENLKKYTAEAIKLLKKAPPLAPPLIAPGAQPGAAP